MSLKGKGYCKPCGKVSYPTEEAAARRAARYGSTKEAYPCRGGGTSWHYGEQRANSKAPSEFA